MFSVVIPAYNCSKSIECVLDSVFSQTRLDLIEEIILINDGSSDLTDSVICNYIKEKDCDKLIKYLVQKNHGVSFTRNRGIRMAKAQWIALLDSDDTWHCDKIEKQYREISRNEDIVFLGADGRFKTDNNDLIKLNAKKLCLKSTPVTPSVIFKKDVGIKYGLFDEKMKYSEDINFFQKFLMSDSYYIIPEELVEISVLKSFHGQSGLSSNLYQMHKGRNVNTKQLYEMGLISYWYYLLMLMFNWMKYIRRVIILWISKIKG